MSVSRLRSIACLPLLSASHHNMLTPSLTRPTAGNKAATFPMQLLGWEVDNANTVEFSNHTVSRVCRPALAEPEAARLSSAPPGQRQFCFGKLKILTDPRLLLPSPHTNHVTLITLHVFFDYTTPSARAHGLAPSAVRCFAFLVLRVRVNLFSRLVNTSKSRARG